MLRRTFLGTLFAAAALLPASSFADPASGQKQPLTAAEIAQRVQDFYNRTATYQASFKQRYTVKAYGRTKDSTGQVVFEKPGKMSWRYTNNGNRVVSDGKLIKIYEKDNKQMYEQPLQNSQYPAALAFLTGTGTLSSAFTLERIEGKSMNYESGFVLLGVPRSPTPAYEKVYFFIDPSTFQVRRMLILDAQHNRNRFDFVRPVVNLKAPPGEFVFIPPAGTQVIRP